MIYSTTTIRKEKPKPKSKLHKRCPNVVGNGIIIPKCFWLNRETFECSNPNGMCKQREIKQTIYFS